MPGHPKDTGALNNKVLRSVNESIVLNLIRTRQPISRVDLARSTNLKESTVSSIVKDLLVDGLISEAGLGASAGGRKPRLLRLNGEIQRVLAIDVAAERTTFGIADLNGALLRKESVPTPKQPERFIEVLVGGARSLVSRHVGNETDLKGIGVSTLGLVDTGAAAIVYSSTLNWHDVRIGDALRGAFGRQIVLDERVRAAGLAELWFGGLDPDHARDLAVVVMNEGVGAVIFSGGRLVRGHTSGAGQFGHITLDPRGPECRCGARGCWERYVAEPSLVERYLTRARRFRAKREARITAAEIGQRAMRGDKQAAAAVRETAGHLGAGLAIIVNAVNPGLIVLDGGICKAWPLVEEPMWEAIRLRALPPNCRSLQVRPSRIEADPCLLGAISLSLTGCFKVPGVGLET